MGKGKSAVLGELVGSSDGVAARRMNTMSIEIFVFFALAASLVLAGFARGPIVVRRVNSSAHRPTLFL